MPASSAGMELDLITTVKSSLAKIGVTLSGAEGDV